VVDPSGAGVSWAAIGNWVTHKLVGCFGAVIIGIVGGALGIISVALDATVIGFWLGIALLFVAVGAIGYGVDAVANGAC
jgi:hypothetical protein